jgi:hypothetical protein
MSWVVEAKSSVTDYLEAEFANSFGFLHRFLNYIVTRLENETSLELKAVPINAPVRCSRWSFDMFDDNGDIWRFLVFYNETANPGCRDIYQITPRNLTAHG